MMINFYFYQHPVSKKIFSDQRFEEFKDRPYISSDGQECHRIEHSPKKIESNNRVSIIDKNGEIFKTDPELVKMCRPKYITFNDGHKERYDPLKHC